MAATPRDHATTRPDQRAVTAQAPKARLAALFDAGGSPRRWKGVRSIDRVDVGSYCIRPKASTNINVGRAVVSVSPEYFFSEVSEIAVQWASRNNGCRTGRIGVYTLADPQGDGSYTFSNQVAFSIVVP